MADTRLVYLRRAWRINEWGNEVNGQLRAETEIAQFRDDLRTVFSDARYKVSDIAKWGGLASCFGYAFILRDTTFNHEWLFGFFARSNSGSSWMSQAWGNNSFTTMGGYFKSFGSSLSDPSTSANCNVIHYNHSTAATYAMGFNNTTNLTYNLGDFQAPASSPYSALASFMPASRIFGVEWGSLLGTNYTKSNIIYDPEIGVMRYDQQYGAYLGSTIVYASGEIFPSNANGGVSSATDTNYRGAFFLPIYQATTNDMSSTNSGAYRTWVQFLRENGTVENTGAVTNLLSNFTRANYRTAGNIDYRKLRVEIPATYTKGFINPAIMCEALPFNDLAFSGFRFTVPGHDDKPLLRQHCNYCIMYKKDYPVYNQIPDKTIWTG